jgi:hypothetical protein
MAPRASKSTASGKNKGSRAGQKSAAQGQSARRKVPPNQSSSNDLPSIGGFQFTEANLAAFKAYQQQTEKDRRAAVAAQEEGKLSSFSAIF